MAIKSSSAAESQPEPHLRVLETPEQQRGVLGSSTAWWIWSLAVAFVVYLFSFQTGYAVVNSSVQRDLGLTIGQVGTIAALYTWAFAIFQFFAGALLDRVGSRAVIPASIALVTLGILLFANAQSYQMLLLSQIVIAIGSCSGFVGAGYIGGQWFGLAKFSFMFGLVQLVASLTSAFSQNLISFTLKHVTWRTLFNVTGAIGLVLLVLGAMYIRNPKPVVPEQRASSGDFFASVFRSLMEVAKIGHVWIAAVIGAATFGAMLSLGVVWMPKLLRVHGLSDFAASFGASMLWLGLAAGSACIPYWSDVIKQRKLPIVSATAAQLGIILLLLYLPFGAAACMALAFLFGFANASHMLSFSTAADVVEPRLIGTSASIVNGIMFIFGGLLISRPGTLIGVGLERGIQSGTLDAAQFAARPLVIVLVMALVLSLVMKETYPGNIAAERA